MYTNLQMFKVNKWQNVKKYFFILIFMANHTSKSYKCFDLTYITIVDKKYKIGKTK